MEKIILSNQECDMIIESLKYTKLKFEDYKGYPSYEYKQQRIEEVNELIAKVKVLKNTV